MTDPLRTAPPAGWYPDPQGLPQQRWWTGVQWTHDTSPHAPVPVPVRPVIADAVPASPTPASFAAEQPVTYTSTFVTPAPVPPVAYSAPAAAPVAYVPAAPAQPMAPVAPVAPAQQFALPATASSDAFPTRRQLRERAQALAEQQQSFEPHTLSPFVMPAADAEPERGAAQAAAPLAPVPVAATPAPPTPSTQDLLPSPPMSAAALFPETHGTPALEAPAAPAAASPGAQLALAPAPTGLPVELAPAAPNAPAGPFSAARAASITPASAAPSFSSTVAQLAPAQQQTAETPASWPFQPATSDAVPYQPFGMIQKLGAGSRDVPQVIYTVAGWLIAALPLVVGAIFAAVIMLAPDSYSRFVQVGILLVFLLASLGLAMRDRRDLQAAGYDTTASPAWTLLTPLVYLIMRSVAVQREAKRSGILVLVWIVFAAAVGAAAYLLTTPETFQLLVSPTTLY